MLENLTFGKRLKELRMKAGITLKTAAKDIKVSRQTLSSYEKDLSKPDYEILKEIAMFYNVSTDYLVGLEEGSTHDLNFIIKQTGLREESVKLLQKYNAKEGFKFELYAIDQIIRHSSKNPFLILLAKYSVVPHIKEKDFKDEKYRKLIPFIASKIYMDDPYEMDNGESLFQESVHIDEFLYYQLIREFYSFLEKVKNDKEAQKKWREHLIYSMQRYLYQNHIAMRDADMNDLINAVDAFMHKDDEEIWGTPNDTNS